MNGLKGVAMAEAVVVEVNRTRDRGGGQLIDLEVTLADGNRQVIAFAYAKVALAVRGLLVSCPANNLRFKSSFPRMPESREPHWMPAFIGMTVQDIA